MPFPGKPVKTAVLGLALAAPRAAARPEEMRVNVREACRQEVAGGYLQVYDDRERLRTYVLTLDEQLADVRKTLAAAKAALAAREKEMAGHDFEVDIAVRRDEAAAKVRNLEAQIRDAEDQRAKAVERQTAAAAKEKELRKAVEAVFTVGRVENKPDGGYPLQLTYKAGCPKYRALCTLPAKDAELLKRIEVDGKLPESCQRYLGLSKLR